MGSFWVYRKYSLLAVFLVLPNRNGIIFVVGKRKNVVPIEILNDGNRNKARHRRIGEARRDR